VFLVLLLATVCGMGLSAQVKALAPVAKDEYYMVTFVSGGEYWKGCFKGFKDAAAVYGAKVVYDGAPEYELNRALTVLNQIIDKKPAGIHISCMDPVAYIDPIKRAMAMGIPVTTFDADSPDSGRHTYLGTSNYTAGVYAARHMGKICGGKGDVAVVTVPGPLNIKQRVDGFSDTIAKEFPGMKVVQIANGGGDQTKSAQATANVIQSTPSIKGFFCSESIGGFGSAQAVKEAKAAGKIHIISFDTDKGTLDSIKEGVIDATIAQGTWNMGYWGFNFLYHLKHNTLNPVEGWKAAGINPLPPTVDTGVTVVTKDIVNSYYIKY
jgi:ribose transport system substrate-binding protein